MAHERHTQRRILLLCLLCAPCRVPGVCTYLMVRMNLQYKVKTFQRRISIVLTLPRFVSSALQSLLAKVLILMQHAVVWPCFFCNKVFLAYFLRKQAAKIKQIVFHHYGHLSVRELELVAR